MGILRDLASGLLQQQSSTMNYSRSYSSRNDDCSTRRDHDRGRYESYAPRQLLPQMYDSSQAQGHIPPTTYMEPPPSMISPTPQSLSPPHESRSGQYVSVLNGSRYQDLDPIHRGVPPPLPCRGPQTTSSRIQPNSDSPPDYYQDCDPSASVTPYGPSFLGSSLNLSRGLSLSRPVILPQLNFGDGVPFVRGYSDELLTLGVSERSFIEFIDALNVTEVPNPEMAIANKAMGLAGWFV